MKREEAVVVAGRIFFFLSEVRLDLCGCLHSICIFSRQRRRRRRLRTVLADFLADGHQDDLKKDSNSILQRIYRSNHFLLQLFFTYVLTELQGQFGISLHHLATPPQKWQTRRERRKLKQPPPLIVGMRTNRGTVSSCMQEFLSFFSLLMVVC